MATNMTSFLDKTNMCDVLMKGFLLYVFRNHRYSLIGNNIHMAHNNLRVTVPPWTRLGEHTVLLHCQNFRRWVNCSAFARDYPKEEVRRRLITHSYLPSRNNLRYNIESDTLMT